ncbi:MAG: hypothetical protein V4717_20565 [Bacteroidota bacterium]
MKNALLSSTITGLIKFKCIKWKSSLPMFLFILTPAVGFCQPSTSVDFENYVRKSIESYNSLNVDSIIAGGFTGFENGFGWRTRPPRPPLSREVAASFLQNWLDGMTLYKIHVDQIYTKLEGNTGLAWGHFTEEFQLKEGQRQVIRVRFTITSIYDKSGWRTVLAHRDIQKFDPGGNYVL